ncbi:MAG: SRPBCC family protein [Ilumatobacter sp.]
MVRYADGPTSEVEVRVDAPPSEVWPLLCDINLASRFSPEFQRAEWTSEGADESGASLGATFQGHNKHPAVGEWNVPCTVTGFEPEAVFEWTVGDVSNKTARWRYELRGDGDGSTLRYSAEMGPGFSGLTPMIEAMPDREEEIVANRLAEWNTNMTATVEGIKALAEGQG